MNTQTQEALKMAIKAFKNNKQTHYYCQDTFYSCPKHEDGCANDFAGTECDCGADETNAEFDKAIQACKEALAQPEQEPVDYEGSGLAAKIMDCDVLGNPIITMLKQCPIGTKLYLKPAPSWQGLSDDEIDKIYFKTFDTWSSEVDVEFARAVEQALKEKNNG